MEKKRDVLKWNTTTIENKFNFTDVYLLELGLFLLERSKLFFFSFFFSFCIFFQIIILCVRSLTNAFERKWANVTLIDWRTSCQLKCSNVWWFSSCLPLWRLVYWEIFSFNLHRVLTRTTATAICTGSWHIQKSKMQSKCK